LQDRTRQLQKVFYFVSSCLVFVVVVGFVHNIQDSSHDTVSSNLGFVVARHAGFPPYFPCDQNPPAVYSVATCFFCLVGMAWRHNNADPWLLDCEAQSVCSMNIGTWVVSPLSLRFLISVTGKISKKRKDKEKIEENLFEDI